MKNTSYIPKDLIKQVKAPKRIWNKLDKSTRTRIVLDFVNGETFATIAERYNTTEETIDQIKKDNKELIDGLKEKKVNAEIEQQQRLYYKTLNSLEKKLDNDKLDDNITLQTNKEMHNQIRVKLSESSDNQGIIGNFNDLKLKSIRIGEYLKKDDNEGLIELLFEK